MNFVFLLCCRVFRVRVAYVFIQFNSHSQMPFNSCANFDQSAHHLSHKCFGAHIYSACKYKILWFVQFLLYISVGVYDRKHKIYIYTYIHLYIIYVNHSVDYHRPVTTATRTEAKTKYIYHLLSIQKNPFTHDAFSIETDEGIQKKFHMHLNIIHCSFVAFR